MSTSTKRAYHHGDLRAALLAAAMRILETGEPFSLRAVAREAGVSPTAPYRHFSDRDAVESALAAQGLRDLNVDLTSMQGLPSTAADLADVAVAYVEFSQRRPALFRLMFGDACDEGSQERAQAAGEIQELLEAAMNRVFPGSDAEALASACWAFAHGMACLYLDGKLKASSPEEIASHTRAAFTAILAAHA